jgi:hypothetical protein
MVGLRLEVFDLLLDTLNVLEHVLLNNFNNTEPVHSEQLVFIFIWGQVVDGLAKLLFK